MEGRGGERVCHLARYERSPGRGVTRRCACGWNLRRRPQARQCRRPACPWPDNYRKSATAALGPLAALAASQGGPFRRCGRAWSGRAADRPRAGGADAAGRRHAEPAHRRGTRAHPTRWRHCRARWPATEDSTRHVHLRVTPPTAPSRTAQVSRAMWSACAPGRRRTEHAEDLNAAAGEASPGDPGRRSAFDSRPQTRTDPAGDARPRAVTGAAPRPPAETIQRG